MQWNRSPTIRYYTERHDANGRFEILDRVDDEAEGRDAIAFYARSNPDDTFVLMCHEVHETLVAWTRKGEMHDGPDLG